LYSWNVEILPTSCFASSKLESITFKGEWTDRGIWKNQLTQKEPIASLPESKDMKSICSPNRDKINSSEAGIYSDPYSECCLREQHDHESSNFDAPRRSPVKMMMNHAKQCDDIKLVICQIRSDWHGEYWMAFNIVRIEVTMMMAFRILFLPMAQSVLLKSDCVPRENVHRISFLQYSREPNGLVI
jgi:hypothetical protein